MRRPGDDVRAHAAGDRAELLRSHRAAARKGLTLVDVPALNEHRAARDLDIERRDWVAVAREPFRAGERSLSGRELTEPGVRDRQEAVEDRGREWVGAPCEDLGRRPGGGPAGARAAERGAQPELNPWIVWPEASVRAIEERERLAVREALERVLARDHQVLGSRRGVASAFEVERDHGRKLAPPLGVQREDRVGGKRVERPAVLLQQRAVRGVLDERVPEEVLELRLERCHLHKAARLKRA